MWKKSLHALLWICLVTGTLLVGGMVFLQLPAGQRWVSRQVNKWVKTTYQVPFEAQIRYQVPDWVEINHAFLGDPLGDSLLVAKKIRVDLDVWALLQQQVVINELQIEDGDLRLVHQNYAFLLPTTDPTDTTAGWPIQLDRIDLQRTRLRWEDSTAQIAATLGKLTTGLQMPATGGYLFKAVALENSHWQVLLKESKTPVATPSSVPSSPWPLVQLPKITGRNVTWSVVQAGSQGWQTQGELAQFEAQIPELNLPQKSGKITSLRGHFPRLTWNDQEIHAFRVDIPEVTVQPTQQKIWVRGFGLTYAGDIQAEGGFRLENGAQKAQLDDFHVQTAHSEIRMTGRIHTDTKKPWYESPLESWQIQVSNPIGRLGWQDIHALYPTLLPDEQGSIRFAHEIRGTGQKIILDQVNYQGPAGSRIQLAGWLKNPGQPDQISGSIDLKEFILPDARWQAFLPSAFRQSYRWPGNIRVKGTVQGTRQEAQWNLLSVTSLGDLTTQGTYDVQKDHLKEMSITWSNLALGTLLRQDSLGKTSGQWQGEVTSLLKPHRRVTFTSQIDQASYGQRAVQDILLQGEYQAPGYALQLQSDQPGLQFDVKTQGKIGDSFSILGQGQLRDIDLQKWGGLPNEIHLTSPIDWSLQIPQFNVEQITGYLQLQTAEWLKGKESLRTQPMRVDIQRQAAFQSLTWASSWLSAELKGQYTLGSLAQEMTRFLNPYFHLQPDTTLPSPQPSQWELVAELRSDPWLNFLTDRRIQFDPIQWRGSFDSQAPEQTRLSLKLQNFRLDSLVVDSWALQIRPEGDTLRLSSEIQGVEQGPLRVSKAFVNMAAADDNLRLGVQVQDSLGKSIHRLGARVAQAQDIYTVALDQTDWQIYYEPFRPIPNGTVTWSAEGIQFDSLGLRSGGQELMIHSAAARPTEEWLLRARDISLKNWTAALLRDTTLVNGVLQADVSLLNPLKRPTYVGKVKIQELAVFQVPLGEFIGESTNQTDNLIAFQAALVGAGNEVNLKGDYRLNNPQQPLKATLTLDQLTAQTLQTFSQGQLRGSKGFLTGKASIEGALDNPEIQGEVTFQDFQTTLTALGTTLRIDEQKISAKNRTFVLDNFQIQDTLDNTLTLQGKVVQTPQNRFEYELTAKTRDFLATNAQRSDNAFFFGAAYVDASMNIEGYDSNYKIRGDVKILDNTRLTAYMPADEQLGSELNQLIQFVPAPNALSATTKKTAKKSENAFDPSTISLKLSVSEKAELTLIMEEVTGDYLRVRGNGQMTTGLDSQGELFILGRFNVKEGAYRMTYQVFERMFVIDEASQSHITWRGKPTDADIQITASYKVNKPLATYPFSGKDLTKDPRLQRQVPFSVDLILRGDMMAPQTTFALSMAKEYVDRQLGSEITTLLEEEGFMLVEKDRLMARVNNPKAEANAEKIKEQAIYMLMFGRFDLLGKRISGGLDAEGFARKQVSQLISDQLDRLASDIIKGVDLDVGVQSEAGANHASRSTNLNLGVKKAFLNDRVSISVGKNFELESNQRQSQEILDHVTANYNITKDGRYRFKAFRSNQYQIEGFVVETGVGFVLTLDYDDRREIFRRSLGPKTKP